MSLSIFQDDELVDALGYASGVATWALPDDMHALERGSAEAKRAWRTVPANWQRELELTRAARGQVSREEYLAELRARAATPAVIAARAERRAERDRARGARPEVREANRTCKAARLDAMPVEERRAMWRRHSQAYRARKRAERGADA